MTEVCEGNCARAVCVIYYPTAQLMSFQPQAKDYTSKSRQTTETTLSHRDHTVNIVNKFYWHIFIDQTKTYLNIINKYCKKSAGKNPYMGYAATQTIYSG